MPKELSKTYDPSAVEARIYEMWEEGGFFKQAVDRTKKPFSIVIPPPNVTGQLHLGHAFDNTLQDIIIRFKRMQGFAALWVPGTDHAGIATQIKVEEALREEEGLTRHDLGREKFLERVWDWKNKYGGRIVHQLRVLGTSCDWSRERFTMDEGCSRAVREAFVSMYEKGLIYRGKRIIHWCPKCVTALSDAEVEYEEREGRLWHIRYPLKDGTGFLTVATTRPETMLGDTAIAVHPDDERYKALVGKTVVLPLMEREIPIIADAYVEREFGTGCVKITPSHDPNDFEVAERHNLPHILIFDGNAVVNENGGRYVGLDRDKAREAVLRDLQAQGLLESEKPHVHNVGSCYRCHSTVEPMDSAQWFVKMKPLAGPAMDVVRDGRMKFVPERFSKVYMNWMENVRDWCVSRQLWWGHRIPAWYCADCGHTTVSRADPDVCEKCQSPNIQRDPDVLDTWFSSGLWPFSVFGWPDKTEDLDFFYPTGVVSPAYDIIFFWVARMIFSGMEHMGDVPFRTAYLHGLIRDPQGKKMSKSAGNGVDPIDVIEQYGADALRMYIISGNAAGADMRFSPEKCESMRNFANKLWNASRFVLMNLRPEGWSLPEALELPDMWIITRLNILIEEVTDNMDKYELGIAAAKVYDFFWSDFCDWYIELSKPRLQEGADAESRQTAEQVLCFTLSSALKLLHPFMPFITEELWQALPHESTVSMVSGEKFEESGALIRARWPQFESRLVFPEEHDQMQQLVEVIRAIRARRAEMNVPPSKKANLYIVTKNDSVFVEGTPYLKKLAQALDVHISDTPPKESSRMVQCVTDAATVYMPLSELTDIEAEKRRFAKELAAAQKEIETLEAKLANPGFTGKAPEKVVAGERERLAKARLLAKNLEESLNSL
ncbi:MAG: valine--tRNA ligase [Oscillospiraceae bacterium]|jgi:valyl-tRNA synthetase|nr:valine--tRNA ligase [Oscillospiraceae bacterium]